MPANAALVDYLLTRRSVGPAFLVEPGPSAEELKTLLTIGTRVPDHGKLAPWRLVLFVGDERRRAGAVLADIAKTKNPGAADTELDVERQRFLPAPLTIGVVSTAVEHPKIPEFEQLISAGNVAFNFGACSQCAGLCGAMGDPLVRL